MLCLPLMLKVLLPMAGAGLLLSAISAQAIPLTARTVCVNCLGPRSNTLAPIGGSPKIDNPVPQNLTDLSGWTEQQLEAGLQKQYDVDVVAVADFLYSQKGEQFLRDSIQQKNYTPYYSQQNSLQAVRSAIILDSADGKLSSYGMMAKLPTDQRLQGAMKVCDVNDINNSQRSTSLLSWYMNTPACISAYTAQQEAQASPAPAVRGLW
jgi:hypothetical protein